MELKEVAKELAEYARGYAAFCLVQHQPTRVDEIGANVELIIRANRVSELLSEDE